MSTGFSQPPSLLSGIERARRPTGPVLGVVVVLGCLLIGQALGVIVFGFAFGIPPQLMLDRQIGVAEQLVLTLSSLGSVLLLAAWLRWKERRPFSSVGFPASRVGTGLGRGALLALALVSVPVLVNLLFGQYEVGVPAALAGALLVLVGFAVQGSTEEIVIRGYLMQVLHRKWGLIAAIVLQALVFAALHGINTGLNAIAVLNLVLVAVFFALWALAEGGLWGVCAFHAVWNWCQGNVYGIEVSGLSVRTTLLDLDPSSGSTALITGGAFGIEGSLVTTLVLGAAVALLTVRLRLKSRYR